MANCKSDFDGHLVVLMDQYRMDTDPNVCCAVDGDLSVVDKCTDTRGSILKLLYWKKCLENARAVGFQPLVKKAGHKVSDNYQSLCEKHGKKAIDIIMEGRLKASVLIHTNGGTAAIKDRIKNAMLTILNNNGDAEVYVPRKALSLGASVFGVVPKRLVTSDSTFLWHLGTNPHQLRKDTEEEGDITKRVYEAQMKEIISFFEESAKPSTHETIMAKIDRAKSDPNNPKNDLWFSGEELYQYGVATEIFADLDRLAHRFYENCLFQADREAGEAFFAPTNIYSQT